MISLELVACAQHVLRDTETGNVSLINLIQEMQPATLPSVIPNLTLLTILRKESGDPSTPDIKVEIASSNGHKQEIPLDVDFNNRPGTRLVTNLQGLPILDSGKVIFTVFEAAEPRRDLGQWTIWVAAPTSAPTVKVQQLPEAASAS